MFGEKNNFFCKIGSGSLMFDSTAGYRGQLLSALVVSMCSFLRTIFVFLACTMNTMKIWKEVIVRKAFGKRAFSVCYGAYSS